MLRKQMYIDDAKNLIQLVRETTQKSYATLLDAIEHIPNEWVKETGNYEHKTNDGIVTFTPQLPTDEKNENIFDALLKNKHLTNEQKSDVLKNLRYKNYAEFFYKLYSEDNIKLLLADPDLLACVYPHYACSGEYISIWETLLRHSDTKGEEIFAHITYDYIYIEREYGNEVKSLLWNNKKYRDDMENQISRQRKDSIATMVRYIDCWLKAAKEPADALAIKQKIIRWSETARVPAPVNADCTDTQLSLTRLHQDGFKSKINQLAQLCILQLLQKKILTSANYLQKNEHSSIAAFLKKSFSSTRFFTCSTASSAPYKIYQLMLNSPKNPFIHGQLVELEKHVEEQLNKKTIRPIKLTHTRALSLFGQPAPEEKIEAVLSTSSEKSNKMRASTA